MIVKRIDRDDGFVEVLILESESDPSWQAYRIVCGDFDIENNIPVPPKPHISVLIPHQPITDTAYLRNYAAILQVVADEADKVHKECLARYEALMEKRKARGGWAHRHRNSCCSR